MPEKKEVRTVSVSGESVGAGGVSESVVGSEDALS